MRLFRGPRREREAAARPANDGAPQRVEIPVSAPSPPACAQCGRTDLPLVGGWDPPICQDCDAAINEDAMQEEIDAG